MAIAPMFKEGFGAETEYAPQPVPALKEMDACYTRSLFTHPSLVNPKAFPQFGIVPDNAYLKGFNMDLLNGGKIYLASSDGSRIEYATPECRTLDEIVYAVLAGNYILPHIFSTVDKLNADSPARRRQPDHRHTVIATNADQATQNVTSVHENYTIPKQLPDMEVLHRHLLPFLASRQLYTGAGYMGPKGGFYLSPAAFGQRFGMSLRDSSRLHLQMGDFNMSPDVIRLKFGATLCMIETIARGWRPRGTVFHGDQGHLASYQISRSMKDNRSYTGQSRWIFALPDGSLHSALDMQYESLDAIDRYLGDDPNPDIQWIRKSLRRTLDALEKDDIKAPWLDWTVKYDLYKKRIGDGSPQKIRELVKLDRSYHYWDMANRDKSSFPWLGSVHPDNKKLTAAITTPPQTTRAKVRGEIVKELLQSDPIPHFRLDWNEIYYQDQLHTLAIDQTTLIC